ncbi:MAG: hypothetical protein Q9M44_03245, partial [Ghiorsea sp.]|nr:hypothetical protein [Ghiorsea sp.]
KHTKDSDGRTERWSMYEKGFRKLSPVEILNNAIEDKYFRISGKKPIFVSDHIEAEYRQIKDEVRNCGETIEDYAGVEGIEIPAEFFLDPWRSKQNRTHKIEALVFSSRSMVWEKDVISKPMITKILQGLRTQNRAVKSIVLISLLMGFREAQLKLAHNIELPEYREGSSDGEQSKLSYKGFNYDKNQCVFWLHHQSVSRSDKFFMFEKQMKILLPKELYQSFPSVEQGEKLFSVGDVRDVKSFLKNFGRDGVTSVTIARLARTFDAFFVESFGLPLLFADILSGRERYYLKSQHFYVTQDLTHLTKQWHSFINVFLNEYMGLSLLKNRNTPYEHYQLAQYKMSETG